jgi:hypothetical protein
MRFGTASLQLTAEQRKDLHSALLRAFPTEEALEQVVSFGLNKNLAEIITGGKGGLSYIVLELIKWAEAHNRVLNLVKAACSENPDNPDLQIVADQIQQTQVADEFERLLNTGFSRGLVRGFIQRHPEVITRIYGGGSEVMMSSGVEIGEVTTDFCLGKVEHTVGSQDWNIVMLSSPTVPLLLEPQKPVDKLASTIAQLQELRRWLVHNKNELSVQKQLPGLTEHFNGVVVAGRRAQLTDLERKYLADFHQARSGITIRTYDWLIDPLKGVL